MQTNTTLNRREILATKSTVTQGAEYLTSTAGALNVNASVTAGATTTAAQYTGQQTVNTSQVQLSSASHALINGLVIKSLSTNSGIIYVSLTGVTASTGDILEPGERLGFAVSNTNLLYIISAASTTDKVSFSAS